MQLIVITSPQNPEQEITNCCHMLELGLQTLHLRKPLASINELRSWILKFPAQFHSSIMLHSHHELAQEFEIKGLHFTEANKVAAANIPKYKLLFSTSFHQLTELQQPQSYFDYAFLSPVFQSISKKDYPAAFTEVELGVAIPQATLPLIALGGITAARLPQVAKMGFARAAVLGAVWESINPVAAYQELQKASQCA